MKTYTPILIENKSTNNLRSVNNDISLVNNNKLSHSNENLYDKKVYGDFVKDCFQKEEQGDATLFVHHVKEKYKYDHTSKCWRKYAGGVWEKDDTKQTREVALEVLTEAYLNSAKILDNEISVMISEKKSEIEIEKLSKLRDAYRKRVKSINCKRRIDNILDLATGKLPVKLEDFDNNNLLFNLKNGTYDFKTNKFRQHSSSDMLTKKSCIEYNLSIECPNWLNFLNKIFDGDKDLILFMQKNIGYSLTGMTDLQYLVFCYGSGANGKTTFSKVCSLLLGDYYGSIPISVLLSKQQDNTTDYQIAKCKGTRMVVASEIPKGKYLNESQVKDLTGQDLLNGRVLYEMPFTFFGTHKLWLFGNNKPVITGTDDGIWRRIKLIPFTVTIPKEKQIELSKLMEMFKNEISGILNWAIEGYKLYRKEGMNEPIAINNATKEYRADSNILRLFFDDCCIINDGEKCYSKDLYSKYEQWCIESKETNHYNSLRKFTSAMKEQGFKTIKGSGNQTIIMGININEIINK